MSDILFYIYQKLFNLILINLLITTCLRLRMMVKYCKVIVSKSQGSIGFGGKKLDFQMYILKNKLR
jgi:hypothetical protein